MNTADERSGKNTADARSRKYNSHDPLTVLHGDELPVQPDPAFAARLRARLESAVILCPCRIEQEELS